MNKIKKVNGISTYVVKELTEVVALKKFGNTNSIPALYMFSDIGINRPEGGVKNLLIPEGINKIGTAAFYDCLHLYGVTLPSTLTHIEDSVFENCTELREVNFPKFSALKVIGNSAFRGIRIREIIIPEGTEEICEEAFAYCEYLKRVVLPDSLKRIGNKAFYGCHNLIEVVTTVKSRSKIEMGDDVFGCPIDQREYI